MASPQLLPVLAATIYLLQLFYDVHGAEKKTEQPSIAIIGAGYAGMAAAYGLTRLHGYKDVTIYEALDRVGGRVWTVKLEEGYFDKGAQFVHSFQSETWAQLLNDKNLVLEKRLKARKRHRRLRSHKRAKRQDHDQPNASEQSEDYDEYYEYLVGLMPGGKQIPKHVTYEWNKLYDTLAGVTREYEGVDVNAATRDPDPSPMSIKKYWVPLIQDFKERTENDESKTEQERKDFKKFNIWVEDHIERWFKFDYAPHSWDDASVYVYVWEDTYPDPQYEEVILGQWGYINVTTRFANQLPEDTIQLNTNITKIKWGKNGVTMKSDDGRKFTADHVIVTSSIGYLENIQDELFSPKLSKRKAGAIKAMGKGCMEKVFAIYEKQFWPDGYDDVYLFPDIDSKNKSFSDSLEDHILIFSTLPATFPTVLEFWLPYPQVLEVQDLPDEEVMTIITNQLAKYEFGSKDPPRPYKLLRTDWCKDPMVLNSFGAFYSVEYDKKGYTRADMIEPMSVENDGKQKPVILFAGEASAGVQATAHGAYWTGLREARRIAKYYGGEVQFKERFG